MSPINLKIALLLLQPRTAKTKRKRASESGLSLLEVLIGILIISVVVVASTPSLILGVATRVQARRAEQAFNVAQQQVQQIELLVEQGQYVSSDLPPTASILNNQDPSLAPAATSVCPVNTCTKYNDPTATQLFRPNGEPDYLVQIFRSPGLPNSTNPTAFNLGVRVYFQSAENQIANLGTTRAPLTLTSADGSIQRLPLAVLYVPICQSEGKDAIRNCNDLLN
ncbi:MAG: hypothetical protein ACFBSE_13075 [Prochloraceae cyanobacterium]